MVGAAATPRNAIGAICQQALQLVTWDVLAKLVPEG